MINIEYEMKIERKEKKTVNGNAIDFALQKV